MSRDKELQRIATLEYELLELKKSISEEDKSKQAEDLFIELMNQGLTIKIRKNGDGCVDNVSYYNSTGSLVVHINSSQNRIWFSYSRFVVVFDTQLGIKRDQIRTLLTSMVEKNIGLVGYHASINSWI